MVRSELRFCGAQENPRLKYMAAWALRGKPPLLFEHLS
jgi:hypothetical protein